jgi:ABC-type uncharacterized transport system substrate-binding protein
MATINPVIPDAGIRTAGRGKLAFAPALALLLSMIPANPVPAQRAEQRVILIVESHASIHQQAALGFEQGFGGAGQIERAYLGGSRHELDGMRSESIALLVAVGTQAARAAQGRFPGIPLLYCLALRPVENDLVGGNVGGVTLDIDVPRQLASIQEAFPQVRRIGVVYDDMTSGAIVEQGRHYLRPGVELVPRVARNPQDAARSMENLLGSVLNRTDVFWMLWDPVVANPANFRRLVQLSWNYKIPVVAPARPFVEAGALMSIGPDYHKAGEQAAGMARQVLNHEVQLAELRAIQPRAVKITVNGEVARRLGIDFPRNLPREVLSPP